MASGAMLGLFIVMQSVILSIRGHGVMKLPRWMRFQARGPETQPPAERPPEDAGKT